ncbi:hypothetical protein JYT23_02170 [Mariprofundus ferrooxydans]|nr:hypothetical protein [Mariprofundus ferrooxydans]
MPVLLKGLLQGLRPLFEAARDLTPIVLVILFFQELVLKQPIPNLNDEVPGT